MTSPSRLATRLQVDPNVVALDEPVDNQIPDAVRLSAYRVVEEALGNIARHAGATHVEVNLGTAQGALRLSVRDDGHGFDPHQARAGLGFGTISAHVGRVGGTWHVDSAPGEGTTLRVTLPLEVVVEEAQDGLASEIALGQEPRPNGASPLGVAGIG